MITHSTAWYQALTLRERLVSLHTLTPLYPGAIDAELADRSLKRWRSQAPFNNEALFLQRLGMDGVTENTLKYLLGESVESLRNRWPASPGWLQQLSGAFNYHHEDVGDACGLLETVLSATENAQEHTRLLRSIEPLFNYALRHLRAGVQRLLLEYQSAPFNLQIIERTWFAGLLEPVFPILMRTMILELNITRLRGQLDGDSPETRFNCFIEKFRDRQKTWSLLEEYPVLARQLTIRISHWLNFKLEFLRHLCDDWNLIKANFGAGQDPGSLMEVNNGVGDPHRGGRSVLIAVFSSGFKIVYKPKSLAVDTHFQELLGWLNERGAHPPFRKLKVFDRGKYGWVEFVAPETCRSRAEVERFYQRQGGYLAVLYALQATDFHLENLIASGEHPVPIDLESLFHPNFHSSYQNESERLASESMNGSVLRVGLLPQRLWNNDVGEGIDISGLGGVPGQITSFEVPYCEEVGTDEMRVSRKRAILSAGQNRPSLNGVDVDPMEFSEAIIEGFTKVYRTLWQYSYELLADGGPISNFAEDEVRVIPRPTKTYAFLLHESYHPDLLRHGLDRERYFDRLWMAVEHRPEMAHLINAERDDLQQGDIPMFTTRPSTVDIWTSKGERVAGFVADAGLSLARRRIQQLGDRDLNQQLWFIRASLATLSMGMDQARWPKYPRTESTIAPERERLITEARAIGDQLEALVLRNEQEVSWLGLTLFNERCWLLLPLDVDLYNGLPGVALFLAYLGRVTEERRYSTLARDTVKLLRTQIERSKNRITSIGGFSGWGGTLYAFAHLGMLLDQPEIFAEAEAIVGRLPELIEQDKHLDVVNGSAGCIAGLSSLYRCSPSDRIIDAAVQCGNRLIASGKPMENGVGWVTPMESAKPLAGFSHGAAGIAWALMELYSLTADERFRSAAISGIAYERSLFSPEVGNWPDLRDFGATSKMAEGKRDNYMLAWCHGAPGIGLARLRSLPFYDDDLVRNEIITSLNTTRASGFGGNHSLCHGDLGNLELFVQASRALGGPQRQVEVDQMSSNVLESINEHGWLCGVPLGVQTPGLMTGLAGIGYELLRLAEPDRVPSILTLEPPLPHK
jgi:type 2 lantibiotic biosynthesis protein LanM